MVLNQLLDQLGLSHTGMVVTGSLLQFSAVVSMWLVGSFVDRTRRCVELGNATRPCAGSPSPSSTAVSAAVFDVCTEWCVVWLGCGPPIVLHGCALNRYNGPIIASLVLATLVLVGVALWMVFVGKPSVTVLAVAFTFLGITMPAAQPALCVA